MAKDSLGREIQPGQVIVYAQRASTQPYVTVGVVRVLDNVSVRGEQVEWYYEEGHKHHRYKPFRWAMFDRMTIVGITEEELCQLKGVVRG